MVKRIKQFLALAVAAALIFAYLVTHGYIVFDHSGVRRGEGVYWNDVLYIPSSGEYTEGKTIAKTSDGWQINEVKEDLLGQPKPADTEIDNKMTPFFNVFLDDKFQSCHYGTELYL